MLIPGCLAVFLILRPGLGPVVTLRQVDDHFPLTKGVLTSHRSPVENIRRTDVTSVRMVFCREASETTISFGFSVLHFSLVVLVVMVPSPVVSEVVVLLLVLGQAVHQVVRRLVGDVREEPVHDVNVPVQLELDGVPGGSVE